MLAYVFWHWRRADIERDAYENALADFHASLASSPPAGFKGSAAFAVSGARWAGTAEAHEDWYLVGGSGDLDILDEAAVAPPHGAPHDVVARMAADGQGGLYKPWLGDPSPPTAAHAVWFGKPAGVTYARLRELLAPVLTASGGGVWCRKMVLGPTPEFCLQSERPAVLPPEVATAVPVSLRRVWPR